MITTYSELKAAVADFLNRDDLTSVISTFVSLAEAQIARDLRHWKQERRVAGPADSGFEQLPVDFLQGINVTRSDGAQLRYLSTADMASEKYRNPDLGTAPAYYSINAGQLELWPAPTDEDITLRYFARVPALSDAEPSNWLLEDMPDIYLYGALLHSAPYLKDDTRAQVWGSLYSAAVTQANKSSRVASTSGGPLVQRVRTHAR
jgi:hypothetical protein